MSKINIKSSDSLYNLLEEAFTGLTEPVTAVALMERPKIRAASLERFGSDVQIATNKLSDRLGFMWRKGVLEKYPSTDTRTTARYAYLLKDRGVQQIKSLPPSPASLAQHALTITEKDGEVILDFKQFTICIKPK